MKCAATYIDNEHSSTVCTAMYVGYLVVLS